MSTALYKNGQLPPPSHSHHGESRYLRSPMDSSACIFRNGAVVHIRPSGGARRAVRAVGCHRLGTGLGSELEGGDQLSTVRQTNGKTYMHYTKQASPPPTRSNPTLSHFFSLLLPTQFP